VLVAAELKPGYVITPYGIRRKECVIEVPHDATIKSLPSGVLEINNAGFLSHVNPPSFCGDDIEEIRIKHQNKRNLNRTVGKDQDINGWLDYGGWFPPSGQNNLQSFTSTYIVPGNPPSFATQVLFYFIGMQDDDDPQAVNIIQPVLTWGNGYQQWYIKSWACCPSNITVSSPPVFGLVPGSTVNGVVVRETDSTWKIDSEFNGQHTTLHAQVGDYQYNWADVTLEVYQLSQCTQFAPNKAFFNQLVLKDRQGQMLRPQWSFTAPTACGGQITQVSSTSIYIEHTP